MIFTPDRLFVLALVITLISADGIYRAWHQRADGDISPRLFNVYLSGLLIGDGLVWFGFFRAWL